MTETIVRIAVVLAIGIPIILWLVGNRSQAKAERAKQEAEKLALAQRSELLRRLSGKDEDEYDHLVFRAERVLPEMHIAALLEGQDPWELYHKDIRAIMTTNPDQKVEPLKRIK